MSSFCWIDHSEKQRRQILEAVDLFREKDTRDELGISGIRDAFSDMLFPGTGALQTRARYFFFIPWMYLDLEARKVAPAELARRVRSAELQLIDRLAETEGGNGTIGIRARESLQRFPSNIYWNGLRKLQICLYPGSQADYHRAFGRLLAPASAARRNDDGELVGGPQRMWYAGLPAAPAGFPSNADFVLRPEEADCLKGRILNQRSLFAFMIDQGYEDADAAFAWEHPNTQHLPRELQRQLEHARCFSEVMQGTAILYNLYLGELDPPRVDVVSDCADLFDEWLELIQSRRTAHHEWDLGDFWKLLTERMSLPSLPTQAFVNEWCRRVLSGTPTELRTAPETKDFIFGRETQVKGALARWSNRRLREMWRGDAGMGRLDYRWSNARTILRDIATGLAGTHA